MKIIFLINRNNEYVGLSNIIDYAIKKGQEVICFHNYSSNKNTNKKYLFPDVKKSPFYKKIKVLKLDFEKNLIDKINKCNFDQIFSRTLPIKNLNSKFLNKINNKFNIIMDSIDIYDQVKKIQYYPNCNINIFCWSEFFKKKILPLRKNSCFAGSWPLPRLVLFEFRETW